MYIKTLWIWVFFIPVATRAQSPITILNSPKFKPENVMHDYAILETDSGAYFYFNFQNKLKLLKSIEVLQFSPQLNLQNRNLINMSKKFSKTTISARIVELKNHNYLFLHDEFRKNSTQGLFSIEFQPSTLNFTNEKKVIISPKRKQSYYPYPVLDPTRVFRYITSLNKTKLLILYTKAHEKRWNKQSFEEKALAVLDENLNETWAKEVRMPYSEADMDIHQYLLSNSGKVFFLIGVKNPKENRVKGADSHFEIFIYDQHTIDKPKIIIPSFGNNFARSSELIENEKGDVFLSGMYSKNTGQNIDGFYAFKLDETTEMATQYQQGFYEIPEELIKANQNEKELRKINKAELNDKSNNVGVSELTLRFTQCLENDDIILLAEQEHIDTTLINNHPFYLTQNDDIYIIRIRTNGESWIRKINKAQYSFSHYSYELSFNRIIKNNNIHIIYTDSKHNLSKGINEIPEVNDTKTKNYLCCITINPEGQMSKSIVLNEFTEECQKNNLPNYWDGKLNSLYRANTMEKKFNLVQLKAQ